MNIYEIKYNELNELSKHELIEKILKQTPYWYARDNKCQVLENGAIVIKSNLCPNCGEELTPNHYVDETKGRIYGVICLKCMYEQYDE